MTTRDLTSELRRALMERESRSSREQARTLTWRASTLLEDLGIPVSDGVKESQSRETLAEVPPADERSRDLAGLPERLGRFTLLGVIGEGGMGRVLEAWDPELGRRVAIKLIRDAHQVSDQFVQRFITEARVTAQLDHPNIVPVHELGVSEEGLLFFVMKRVQGVALSEVIAQLADNHAETMERFGIHRLLTAFIAVCNALAYAHERGVIHRDLKPENIMIGDFGEVVVMDWGVARLLEDDAPEPDFEMARNTPIRGTRKPGTQHGSAVGTPGFMSPEQARGRHRELGPATDAWSLGAVLYELITLTPPYIGASTAGILQKTVDGPPQLPHVRAPERRISETLAGICMSAFDPVPENRPSARELARQVQGYLEGRQRRARASDEVSDADAAWARHQELVEERSQLRELVASLEEQVEPWTPIEDKRPLIEKRTRLHAIAADIADAFETVVASCERALSHDRKNDKAHDLLANAYWFRLGEADARGDVIAAKHYAGRVRVHDRGSYSELLDGEGQLTLDTVPSGAEVLCLPFERSGLIWETLSVRQLGHAPLKAVSLPMGSYLLDIRVSGFRRTRYPVQLVRGRPWNAVQPVRLLTDEEIGDGWIYVPGGPFVEGGDPYAADSQTRQLTRVPGFLIAELPVTCGQYAEFLNALFEDDPEQAWRRVPREVSGPRSAAGQYWPRPEPGEGFRFPLEDRDGAVWKASWPVTAVSWDDAMAYARWLSETTGELHRLPRSIEWEKAARGVDGRIFPWGDVFDPTLCRMRDSRPSNKSPDPVGTFEADVSVYGVRDMAGMVSEWCAGASWRGDTSRRVARGGSWMSAEQSCRLASRLVLDASYVYQSVGFRLARDLPRTGRD